MKSEGKICIYLDQFAISDMVEMETKLEWSKIKKLLIELKDKNKIFCPLSHEHYIETSQNDIERAIRYDKFLSRLSDGYSFKPELFITSQLISSRVRNNNVTLKTYLYENVSDVFRKEENYKRLKESGQKLAGLLKEANSNLNQFRTQISNQNIDLKSKTIMIKAMNSLRVKGFIQRLEDLLLNDNIVIRGEHIGEMEVPNWIDLIIDQLLKRHRFNKKEVISLISEFKKNGFSNIPTLNISTTLLSYMAIYSKKERSNDHIDIMRISTGLPISQILLTDKKRKAELIESELGNRYKTKVFSGTRSDLNELFSELKKME